MSAYAWQTSMFYSPASKVDFPRGSDGKASATTRETWVGKIPWRRTWQPTPVFSPGRSHGRRSLVGCSQWGHRDSDTTERLHFHFHQQKWLIVKNLPATQDTQV